MTNEERKEMYHDWENLLGTHLDRAYHEERMEMLESLLKGIGKRLDYDMTSLLLAVKAYDKEACKPISIPVEVVEVGKVYRVIEDEIGVHTYLFSGDIVRVLRKPNRNKEVYVQSLMRTTFKGGDWYTPVSNLEEV